MDERQKLALYEHLEPWAEGLAVTLTHKYGLHRWADDVVQEARLALFTSIERYDGARCEDVLAGVKVMTYNALRAALRKYVRWDSREKQCQDVASV